ncbi:hypothetical protein FRC04_003334 [Tulasnella sp. 424]|nr:hypothetical protein FRC04_003334 [Tulasnella sp. 424]KAG8977152.1 hypothetical protein FRC05_002149 [Tulasnella sp. 425]
MATWDERYTRLATILKVSVSSKHDAVDLALDSFTDAQRQPGRSSSSRAAEVEKLRFGNKDLTAVGTLTKGQFGNIHIVRCQFDGEEYVRKTISKSTAIRFRHQCSVFCEREILLRARQKQCVWVPHLLTAFQSSSDLNFVMEYAAGGSLDDVLNCAPAGHLEEKDLLWWAPQAMSAISWCHSQQFVHRDVKPQNLVITASSHIKLIDFGTAAPLLPPDDDGAELVARKHCLMLCGTVDYIAPEILQHHENLLVACEVEDSYNDDEASGAYGKEVDWWSLGAMLYELACGQAPFFANDIGQTYRSIINHKTNALKFNIRSSEPGQTPAELSPHFQDMIKGLLCPADSRLGRNAKRDIQKHPWLSSIRWDILHIQSPHADLAIPHDSGYEAVKPPLSNQFNSELHSPDGAEGGGVRFSAFFDSTMGMSTMETETVQSTPGPPPEDLQPRVSSFIGFTWGPSKDAFSPKPLPSHQSGSKTPLERSTVQVPATPYPIQQTPGHGLFRSTLLRQHRISDPLPNFITPMRPNLLHYPTTIPRTGSARRVRPVSDRQAMEEMMAQVGKSARKRVLESGKKPRNGTGLVKFAPLPPFHPGARDGDSERDIQHAGESSRASGVGTAGQPSLTTKRSFLSLPPLNLNGKSPKNELALSAATTITEATILMSPSPRPGSAMSRRSATPGLHPTFTSMSRTNLTLTMDRTASGSRIARSKTPDWTSSATGLLLNPELRATPKSVAKPRKEDKRPTTTVSERPTMQSEVAPSPTRNESLMSDDRMDEMQRRLDHLLGDISQLDRRLLQALKELRPRT